MRRPRRVAVGAEGNDHARLAHPGQVAGLNSECFLNVRIVAGRLQLGNFLLGVGAGQPAQIGGDTAGRHVRNEHRIEHLAEQRHEFIIDILIANAMGKDVHIGAKQALGIIEIEDVRRNADAVLVRFIDGGTIQFRSELLVLSVAVIDPELDQVDTAGRLRPNGFPGFLLRVDPMDDASPRLRPGDAQPRGTEPRGAGNFLVANRQRFLGVVRTHADGSAHAEPGALAQVVDERVAARVHVHVGIHDHRHDGHAAEIHARGAFRRSDFTGSAHRHENASVDDDRRIVNGV